MTDAQYHAIVGSYCVGCDVLFGSEVRSHDGHGDIRWLTVAQLFLAVARGPGALGGGA